MNKLIHILKTLIYLVVFLAALLMLLFLFIVWRKPFTYDLGYGDKNFSDEINFTYDDEIVFEVKFPEKVFTADLHYGDDYYHFFIENDYRMMSDVFKGLMEEHDFIVLETKRTTQSTYRRTKGSNRLFYNYIDLKIDNERVESNEGYFITDDGFMFELIYDSFTIDDEQIIVPLTLTKCYHEAYIPKSFESIEAGNITQNNVTLENRINVSYEPDYLYIHPGVGFVTSHIRDVERRNYRDYQSLNDYIPEPGHYNICRSNEEENCFVTSKQENLFLAHVGSSKEEIKKIYIDYYEGVEIDQSIYFTFLDKYYELQFTDDFKVYIYPVFEDYRNSDDN